MKTMKTKSAIRPLIRFIWAFEGREKGRHPTIHDSPFWLHFPSTIDEQIDAEIDAEKVMNIEEK